MGNKGIYVYVQEETAIEALKAQLQRLGLPDCQILMDNMGDVTVKEMIDGVKLEGGEKLVQGNLVLFNGFSPLELNKAVKAVISTFDVPPLLATVTETTLSWELNKLLEHLKEEREFFEGK